MNIKKTMTCIMCPKSCQIMVVQNSEKVIFSGANCEKGISWCEREIVHPERVFTGNVLVKNGDLPLLSIKSDRPIRLEKFAKLVDFLNSVYVEAPVSVGAVVFENPVRISCNLIATRTVKINTN